MENLLLFPSPYFSPFPPVFLSSYFSLTLPFLNFSCLFPVAGAKTDRDLGGQDDHDKTPVSSVVYSIHSGQVL